jgi:hypothetical protein
MRRARVKICGRRMKPAVSEAAGRWLAGGRACGKGVRAYHGCTSFSAVEQRGGARSLVASGRGDGDGGGRGVGGEGGREGESSVLKRRRRGQRGSTATLGCQARARLTRIAEQRQPAEIYHCASSVRRDDAPGEDAAHSPPFALATALHRRPCLYRVLCAMNLSLVDPFVLAQDCPDVITGRLREC